MDMSRRIAFPWILIALSALLIFPADQARAGDLANQLISAAERGELDKVKRLLDQGVPIDATDPNGWTALMKATYEGHAHIVQELIARGAGVDIQENAG